MVDRTISEYAAGWRGIPDERLVECVSLARAKGCFSGWGARGRGQAIDIIVHIYIY